MSNKEIIVSIIIPAYNAEKTIDNCIQGILKQTVHNWQLFIVNDGSTDNTEKILDKYALQDSRIKIFHQENKGVSAARNYAIKKVETPYFVCVDSDDYIFPTYLEELLKAKKLYPECLNIWSCFQTVNNQLDRIGEKHLLSDDSQYVVFDKKDAVFLYKKWMMQMPWHRLYDTSVVKINQVLMNEKLSLGEDFLFNLDYLDATGESKIVVVNAPTYNYVRSDKDSLDHKYRKDLYKIYQLQDHTFEKYIIKWKAFDYEEYINSCFFHYENVLRNTFHPDNKESFIKKIQYNNRILKSEECKEILKNKTCYVNQYYDKAYKTGNYVWIVMLDWILSKRKEKTK